MAADDADDNETLEMPMRILLRKLWRSVLYPESLSCLIYAINRVIYRERHGHRSKSNLSDDAGIDILHDAICRHAYYLSLVIQK